MIYGYCLLAGRRLKLVVPPMNGSLMTDRGITEQQERLKKYTFTELIKQKKHKQGKPRSIDFFLIRCAVRSRTPIGWGQVGSQEW